MNFAYIETKEALRTSTAVLAQTESTIFAVEEALALSRRRGRVVDAILEVPLLILFSMGFSNLSSGRIGECVSASVTLAVKAKAIVNVPKIVFLNMIVCWLLNKYRNMYYNNNHMKPQGINLTYFTTIIVIVAAIAIYVLWPFVGVLAMAGILAVVLGPVYRFFLVKVKGRKTLASTITLVLFLFAIILPLIFVLQNVFVESSNFYVSLSNRNLVSFEKINSIVESYAQKLFPQFRFDVRERLVEFSLYVVDNLGAFFAGAASFGLKLFLSMFALFYFLRDGDKFKEHIMLLSPLPRKEDEKVVDSLKNSINSIVVGSVTVAALQAAVIWIGFLIFGVPNPALCAIIVALAALFPGVGPSIVWIPATIYLFIFGGNFPYAWIGFVIYCPVLFTYNDTFLGPKLIEKGSNIHPLIILFSILGGVVAFGPEGLILGPTILAFLFTLIRVYQDYAKERSAQA